MVTGEIQYEWWGDGEPSADGECIDFYPHKYKFNDFPCHHPTGFFCETESQN